MCTSTHGRTHAYMASCMATCSHTLLRKKMLAKPRKRANGYKYIRENTAKMAIGIRVGSSEQKEGELGDHHSTTSLTLKSALMP